MLFHLSTADRLRNSDNYALFALFLREVQTSGNAAAVPAGISTPATDTLAGFSATERPVLELALAKLEKRLTWANDWVGQLYGEAQGVRSGTTTWAASWAEDLMKVAAKGFPLTAPPAAPTLTDQARLAGILDRYGRMKLAVKRNLTATRMAAGVVNWPVAATWVAGAGVSIGPDFFRATAGNQVAYWVRPVAAGVAEPAAGGRGGDGLRTPGAGDPPTPAAPRWRWYWMRRGPSPGRPSSPVRRPAAGPCRAVWTGPWRSGRRGPARWRSPTWDPRA